MYAQDKEALGQAEMRWTFRTASKDTATSRSWLDCMYRIQRRRVDILLQWKAEVRPTADREA